MCSWRAMAALEPEPRWSVERALCIYGEEAWLRAEIPVLDKARVSSATAATAQLNAEGDALCPGGLCAVFSKSKGCYVVLFREDRRADADSLASRCSCSAPVRPSIAQPRWRLENSASLCGSGEESRFERKAPLLDKRRFPSVVKATKELNEDPGLCAEGVCVVFSQSQGKYVLIFREDMRAVALERFGLHSGRMRWSEFSSRMKEVGGRTFGGIGLAIMGKMINFISDAFADNYDPRQLAMTHSSSVEQRYVIVQKIGAGAQGIAHLVRRRRTNQMYVAKEAASAGDQDDIMFEFRKMQELRHPNCVRVVELLRLDGKASIIVEHAKCGDLYEYMEAAGRSLAEDVVAGIVGQAMRGMAFLHASGCVHNDIKPDNLLVLEELRRGVAPGVVISDYGCARFSNKEQRIRFGDPRYQSPENLRQQLDYMKADIPIPVEQSPKGDVWSMGVTLYEMLSDGIVPFVYERCSFDHLIEDDNFERLQTAILEPGDVVVEPHCQRASSKAVDILRSLLCKDASVRPAAREVLEQPWLVEGLRIAAAAVPATGSRAAAGRVACAVAEDPAHQILLNAVASRLPRGVTRWYEVVFSRFCLAHAGRISRDEFKQALLQLGQNVAHADDVFLKADVDGSDSLEFNEFLAMTFDWASVEPSMLEKHIHDMLEEICGDTSGVIDKTHLARLCGRSTPLDALFASLDSSSSSSSYSAARLCDLIIRWHAAAAPAISFTLPRSGPREEASCTGSGSPIGAFLRAAKAGPLGFCFAGANCFSPCLPQQGRQVGELVVELGYLGIKDASGATSPLNGQQLCPRRMQEQLADEPFG